MSLIINKQIPQMMVGFPTVSDKYNVAGGILTGSNDAHFGDLVKLTAVPGYYEIDAFSAVTDIGGFILGTNVKLADWPTGDVKVYVNEAFNLLINGFIAVALDENADPTEILPNSQVCVILATGKCTTSDAYSSGTVEYLPNCVFTGFYETKADGTIVAEVYVK